MALQSPNLDDRRFVDLVADAHEYVRSHCPAWSDLSPGDPGSVLVELFAYLTEVMIHRINRLPEKVYIEFLHLMGVSLNPPLLAHATIEFSRSQPLPEPLVIPRLTRVSAKRESRDATAPTFYTLSEAIIPSGERTVAVSAVEGGWIEGELLGRGTGQPGLSLPVRIAPIPLSADPDTDVVIGVESGPGDDPSLPLVSYGGKGYRMWQPVAERGDLHGDRSVYLVDRYTGLISFPWAGRERGGIPDSAPAVGVIRGMPGVGREIRAWYRTGGGPAGNVSPQMITVLRDSISGVTVTNPSAATGGRRQETLEEAMARGPQELHSLKRVVTARDYEMAAVRGTGVASRAFAFPRREVWSHANPGSVEVVLVPAIDPTEVPTDATQQATYDSHDRDEGIDRVRAVLDRKRPLGTSCTVSWARYKPVSVSARIVVHREHDPTVVRERLTRSLYQYIHPLAQGPTGYRWQFGQSLRAFDVYRIIGDDPGVQSIGQVRLTVAAVPERDVRSVAADRFQNHTWYCGSGDSVYRSLDDGIGWEAILHRPDENVLLVRPWERTAGDGGAGLLAVTTQRPAPTGGGSVTQLLVSADCGESWQGPLQVNFAINDLVWVNRSGVRVLLAASERGLYEVNLPLDPGAGPKPLMITEALVTPPCTALAVSADPSGGIEVAVACGDGKGVYLSTTGGTGGSFRSIGLGDALIRVLGVHHAGPHRYVWAGTGAPGTTAGAGCYRWRLVGTSENAEGWRQFGAGWDAGSCNGLAFCGSQVFAATQRMGVLSLSLDTESPGWKVPDIRCGLPMRDIGRFQPVTDVAGNGEDSQIMVGGPEGVYAAAVGGEQYRLCSNGTFEDLVTVPRMRLLCSGDHRLTVEGEDAS